MFGCCVAGRPLQTAMTQVDETHAYFELPGAGAINHISIFLLGTMPFPDGYGATVHFFWPGKGFQLLGMLSNEKPSAIFRLKGTYTSGTAAAAHLAFSQSGNTGGDNVTAILGLAVEPLSSISATLSALPSAVSSASRASAAPDATLLAERIVKHLFNYLSGFGEVVGPQSVVPMGVVVRWYESFLGKVRAGGMGFLEREQE